MTSDANDYAASIQTNGTADLDAIAQRMIDQGSTTTKVTAMQKNKPAQLVFLVPGLLPAMNYQLEVRARLGDDTSELRTGRLDAELLRI